MPAPRDRVQSTDEVVHEAVPPLQVLIRLMHEGIAARIRHRALLDVLAHSDFSMDRYKTTYAELLERDRDALMAKALLSKPDFEETFSGWIKEDSARYALPKASRPLAKRTRRK